MGLTAGFWSPTLPIAASGPATPSLIQMVSSSTNVPNVQGEVGQDYKITLPNSCGAGNRLVLAINYPSGATPSVSDNIGNTWSSPIGTIDNGAGNMKSAIFELLNTQSGYPTFTVHFAGGAVQPFQYHISEWYNTSTSVASTFHGTAGSSGATPSCGSFTPINNNANGGNLIVAYFCLAYFNSNGVPTNWAPSGSFTLLDADIASAVQGIMHASEMFIQTTAAAINPGMTITGDSADSWNSMAIAIPAANAGTPKPAGIHVDKILHFSTTSSPATWNMQVPCTGNLRVLAYVDLGNSTGCTGNDSTTWTKRAGGGFSTAWESANRSANSNLAIAVATAAGNNQSARFYDISGAAASSFDTSTAKTVTDCSSVTTITDWPAVTPLTANGLVIAFGGIGQGPGLGFASGAPANAVFDLCTYTGETDASAMENADLSAHYYNPSAAQIHWNWTITSAGTNSADGLALAYK